MLSRKGIIIAFSIILLIMGGLFYFRNQVYYAHTLNVDKVSFSVKKGEKNVEIAERLKQSNLITGKIYFYYYLKTHKLAGKIMPGVYILSSSMTIPEVVHILTNPQEVFIKVTFPEGFTAKQMATRLKAENLPGDKFLQIVNNPESFKKRYSYLTDNKIKTLEGYLFPDTYFFKKDITAENIVGKLLDNFNKKVNAQMRKDIFKQKKSLREIVIMASIIEKEVQTSEDMKIVAGIFWKRLANKQKLQSDAPLSYILEDKNDQHQRTDLKKDSPYNTYLYLGLPPGSICNPGLKAISATIYPKMSPYNYFLTATVKGAKKVIYAKTFSEHIANRKKYGL